MNYGSANYEYVGNADQLITVTDSVIENGRAKGVRMIHVSNSAGLELICLPDRCMDFYQLRYRGNNMNYITSSGIAAPSYYDADGIGFLRGFFAGFLTTCGLRNIGDPGDSEGQPMGLHGRIGNLPAEEFSVTRKEIDGELCAVLHGKMTETDAFGVRLSLTRDIVVPFDKSEFYFTDTVKNEGFTKEGYVQLYHFNMGYPLLSPDSRIVLDSKKVFPRNDYAADFVNTWRVIEPPHDSFDEICLYHEVARDENGNAEFGLENPSNHLGLRIRYNADMLPNFLQWKMFRKGSYVMGLEPTNGLLGGYNQTKEKGALRYLEPGAAESHSFKVYLYEA